MEPITEPVKLGVVVVAGTEVIRDEVEVKDGRPKSTGEEDEGTATTTAAAAAAAAVEGGGGGEEEGTD
jgi:hypothetical protein